MMAILLAVVMALPACASAEGIRIDGKIEAVRTQTILAPHSGRVGDYAVRVGDELNAGDELFTLSAQKVYADFDGVVTGKKLSHVFGGNSGLTVKASHVEIMDSNTTLTNCANIVV